MWGGAYFYVDSHAHYNGPSAPQFFGVPLYLCIHPLTQNDQIRRHNEWLVACFRRSATPLHLRKCVGKFVNDS